MTTDTQTKAVDRVAKRRLTVTHMALARGWIQGLELSELANRYLAQIGEGTDEVDLRAAKSALTWVLDDLAGLAKRAKIAGGVTLQRQASRIRLDPNAPSLADFASAMGVDEDFYSEQELIELFQEQHGDSGKKVARAEARRERLIKRQMNLITDLTLHLTAPMALADKIVDWLEDGLAQRLIAAGFETIEDLAVAIVGQPDEWFNGVQGVGEGKAARIVRFLHAQLGPIDERLAVAGIPVFRAVTPMAIEMSELVAAFDRSAIPSPAPSGTHSNDVSAQPLSSANLDGSQGDLRAVHTQSATSASNDYEALTTWLSLKKANGTKALYKREIERLMAWAIRERGCALSSLRLEDAVAYRDFLSRVPDTWTSSKGPRKQTVDGHWRPFAGSLAPSSTKKALVIINGFFGWLRDTNYIVANPFVGVKAENALPHPSEATTSASDLNSIETMEDAHASVRTRTLPHQAKAAIEEELNSDPESEFLVRAGLVFRFAYETGLRISEIAAARWGHTQYHEATDDEGGHWTLAVVGKRSKARIVLLSETLITHILQYMDHRGLPSTIGEIEEGTYIVGRLPSDVPANPSKSKRPISNADGVRPQTIHRTLKTLFGRAMLRLSSLDKESRTRLQKATTHWLRHTCATDMLESGVPAEVVKEVLGHEDLKTTSIYIHPDLGVKSRELKKYWAKSRAPK